VKFGPKGRFCAGAVCFGAAAVAAAWLDARYGWITPAFDTVAHLFYESPIVAFIRRPSQLVLVRWHLAIGAGLLALGILAAGRLNRHGRWVLAVFAVGYALRAAILICGGNLPMVRGDSCHYIEVATSVLRGEGPVKHYVGSFFNDYPHIREGRGGLDDWDTPLYSIVVALATRLLGFGPDSSLDARIAIAKGCSFLFNIACLPALYVFARRRYDSRVALGAMAALAVLPVHAIYAGFEIRESLVALTSILAVWALSEVCIAAPGGRAIWGWALAAGLCGGLAVMARTTALALLAGGGLYCVVTAGRRRYLALLVSALFAAIVCLPWAYATWLEYGTPFYSMTRNFEYNFSWTVHHYMRGNTLPSEFYTLSNMPEIVRVKAKSVLLIAVTSTMIVGLPLVLGFWRQLFSKDVQGRGPALLVVTIFGVFVVATLKQVADVTQVLQLGRYYLPVFAIALPAGVAGALAWLDSLADGRRVGTFLAVTWCALVWADPTWAHDVSWLSNRYQLHWAGLREAGEWIRANPDKVPPRARIMTSLPWELRVTSDRTTILMPNNYKALRIQEVLRQYQVTHFLWGSFEPPPFDAINPEGWSSELEHLRTFLRLTDGREVYRTTNEVFFPLRLYRLQQAPAQPLKDGAQ
jgi:Dolichyl-phosphate-mannose-protein mannosyltransferase